MTPQEINIAIAQACGWNWESKTTLVHPKGDGNGYVVFNDKGEIDSFYKLPQYHTSLDACAEFEATLTSEEREDYCACLWTVTAHEFATITATAPQRCEAFLRVKGPWREDNAPQVTRTPAAHEGAAKLTRHIRGVTGGAK